MSTLAHSLSLVGVVALMPWQMAVSCYSPVDIFPSEDCSPGRVPIELQQDREVTGTSGITEHHFHATAGCTIIFDAQFFDDYVEAWRPLAYADYELRLEPEGPLGRLERGSLPEDGRLTVPTVEGNTSVRLTIFQPDNSYYLPTKMSAVVNLD